MSCGGCNVTVVGALPADFFANPTALVGLTPVNGSATTGIRSDGAPALDQGIVPTWTGVHTFNNILWARLALGSLSRVQGCWSSDAKDVGVATIGSGSFERLSTIAAFTPPSYSIGQGFSIRAFGQFGANGNNKQVQVVLRNITTATDILLWDSGVLTTNSGFWDLSVEFNGSNATFAKQTTFGTLQQSTGVPILNFINTAVGAAWNTDSMQLQIGGIAGAGDILLNGWTVNAHHAP